VKYGGNLKMNKKGETNVGGIVLFAIAVIVGLVFVPIIFSQQSVMVTTYTETQTAQAVPTVTTALTGQSLIGTATVVNETGAVDCSANYTITDGVDTATNTKRVLMTPVATDSLCTVLNYSYTYGPEGYVDNSGGRALAGNIGLFAALALLGAAIYYFVKNNGGLFNI
jgi:uncharacterized protein HemX